MEDKSLTHWWYNYNDEESVLWYRACDYGGNERKTRQDAEYVTCLRCALRTGDRPHAWTDGVMVSWRVGWR